ncbi:MAG TPA: sensor histidine kinase, partial [Actinomycetota bacterium]|nr:sensor histidine kinase [Actinomycetota bacterium]
ALPLGQPLPHRAAILVAEAMAGGRPVEAEIEAAGAVTDVRVVPLLRGAGRRGALVLVREATELRRRDRVISRREATIREVHHRVKNNLQTVASLLRLQARRLGDHPQAVAALEDSVRRITSIALVHETLTEEFEGAVDMADVARRIVKMLTGSLGREDAHIELRTASVRVDAAVATPLAVVLNELVQNAVEHGLGDGHGTVTVELRGGGNDPVVLQVHDDGDGGTGGGRGGPTPPRSGPVPGSPEGETSRGQEEAQPAVHSPGQPDIHSPGSGLGLRLVRALVEEELGGQFTLTHPAGRGSVATATVPPSNGRPERP